jgi:outer membrane protein OmpA-like peptidoglycan-associated protein
MSHALRATLLAAPFLLIACTHAPPEELVDARAAYRSASAGAARQLVPAELHDAQTALEAAEIAYEERDSDYVVRDLSYVAQRKAELAVTLASVATSTRAVAASAAALERVRADRLQDAEADLVHSTSALARSQAELEAAATVLSMSEEARREAAARADTALAALAKARSEPRGLVITLSGSVLFRTDDATLAPDGVERLEEIADALLLDPNRHLVVEGHTDSRGDDAYNLALSQQRADAVRQVLIDRGYRDELLVAKGMGESKPIADNDTPEGMANNRRVEIVVQREDTVTGQR